MIKTVIFDWGGVISPFPKRGWLGALAKIFNTTAESLSPYWSNAGYSDFSKGIIDEATFWQQFEESFGKPIPKDVAKIWMEGGALHPWPEMQSFVQELKDNNIQVAILSNMVRPASFLTRELGLYKGYSPIVLSDEVGFRKPEPEIYKIMLNKLNVIAAECIFVDDIPKNLEPAANLGMNTILAKSNPKRTIADIEQVLKVSTDENIKLVNI
jgi:putative hydrolase of the HAD superfamily